MIDACFSATKSAGFCKMSPKRRHSQKAAICFRTIDTWLIWNLTGGQVPATDYSNASRTMLFNIHTLEWDTELLDLLEIPRSILPEVRPSSGHFLAARPLLLAKASRLQGRRRSAVCLIRAGVLLPRHRQEYLWHRRLSADEHRRQARFFRKMA